MTFYEIIKKYNSVETLQALSVDGCKVNTGRLNGMVQHIEQMINRPLQWLVCVLHLNELLLKHLFEKLDGPTSGPESYTVPIGKLIGGKGIIQVRFPGRKAISRRPTATHGDLETFSIRLFMQDT